MGLHADVDEQGETDEGGLDDDEHEHDVAVVRGAHDLREDLVLFEVEGLLTGLVLLEPAGEGEQGEHGGRSEDEVPCRVLEGFGEGRGDTEGRQALVGPLGEVSVEEADERNHAEGEGARRRSAALVVADGEGSDAGEQGDSAKRDVSDAWGHHGVDAEGQRGADDQHAAHGQETFLRGFVEAGGSAEEASHSEGDEGAPREQRVAQVQDGVVEGRHLGGRSDRGADQRRNRA